MQMTPIKKFIHLFRMQQVKGQFIKGLMHLAIFSIPFLLISGILESIFYYSMPFRLGLAECYFFLFFSYLTYLLLRAYLNAQTIFNNSNNHSLAEEYESRNPQISDRLLNALQLEESLEEMDSGKDLAEHAIKKLDSQLKDIPISSLYDPISNTLKKILAMCCGIAIVMTIFMHDSLPGAFIRLTHPSKDFPAPLPFTLKSLSQNQKVLGGDTLTISIAGYGDLPDSIPIIWENKDESGIIMASLKNEVYDHVFFGIKKDTRYWASHEAPSWFSSWDVISTFPDTIFVMDRPVIQDMTFTIIPPTYTQENETQHPGNITDIPLPEGSHMNVSGKSTKTLNSAWVMLNEKRHDLFVQNNHFNGTLQFNSHQKAEFHVEDENGVENLHHPNYRMNIIPDSSPDLFMSSPSKQFELDESDLVGFDIQTSDDYGFSDAWIEYEIKAPDYLPQDTNIYKRNIPELQHNVKSQQIYHEWSLANFSLAPEDELHIQVFIADNNILTGPSITSSQLIIGRYPSLEDLFNRIEDDEEDIEEYNDDIQMTLEDVQELVEELELELLKTEDVTWEQEQKIAETMEKMDEIFSQIEKVQETMQRIQEQAEENNLFSDELVDKFSQFQDLLDEVMTPELLEAMQKMQEAMEEMDPQKLLDALKDFEFDMEAFEEQLDRFIDMFELALAEQKMDEVVKRLEKMLEEQTQIVKELTNNDVLEMTTLSSRERRQEESFKAMEKTMDDAATAMEKLSPEASKELTNLAESELTKETSSDLNEARKEMQNQNQSKASQSAGKANSGLEEMLEIAQNIQSDFQEDTVDEMLRKFLALIQNILFISQSQEELISETQSLRSRSPKLIGAAVKQDRILRENQQFMLQLTELSRQTFHISPEIAHAIGRTKAAMDKAIAKLEQKQTSSAKNEMNKALDGLNQTAFLLLESANQMQMSGSGSGFAQFMEQMAEMSETQKGINQGTSQLPQLGMMAQQQMMQQLQQQQEQLKNQLEELMKENPGQESGGLSKAGDDMEEVIDDFRKRQVNRRTQERQERILSRMLDSQKSLTQKDYSEKRKSTTAEKITYSGPTGLPADKGEREMLLINAMESALQEGHSREYQNMMKQYFRNLQKEESNSHE